MTKTEPQAGRNVFTGLFLVALSTLMFEILLTRIFSVTMWYHFAFMAISVAMFGMTVGAILVYLMPSRFTPERAVEQLARYSLYFGVAIVVAFLAHLRIHFGEPKTLQAMFSLAGTYVVVAIPFVFSGVAVCLALTRFPQQVSRLYAADLAVWLWTNLFRGVSCRAYNVGSDVETSIVAVADAVVRAVDQSMPVVVVGRAQPGAAPERYVPSVGRASDELGLRPTVSLDDAIRRTVAWHRATSTAGTVAG